MKYLVTWETNNHYWPSDPEERTKLIGMHIGMAKQDLDSGTTKDWGVSPGGGKGYAITDEKGKEKLSGLLKYSPYYTFDIVPMLSIDELAEAFKGMQK